MLPVMDDPACRVRVLLPPVKAMAFAPGPPMIDPLLTKVRFEPTTPAPETPLVPLPPVIVPELVRASPSPRETPIPPTAPMPPVPALPPVIVAELVTLPPVPTD